MSWVGILNECSSKEDELRARLIAELYRAEMGSRHTSDGPALLPLVLEMADTYNPGKCAALAERFVRNKTWVVPNLMTARLPSELGRGWREDSYARFLTPGERRWFESAAEVYARDLGGAEEQAPVSRWAREVTRAMHRAGVSMLAGSDAGAWGIFWGIGLHQELELLVDAGLTEAEALRTATLGPAEFLAATDSIGTVEPGKVADLVLLEANPLEDIRNTQRIAAVVLRGRYLDREALDGLLAVAERAAQTSAEPVAPGSSVAEEVLRRFEPADCWFDTAAIEAGAIHCGYVQVPEDRAKPDGRVIRLAVAVAEPVEATASGRPIALLPGGPGMTVLRGGRGISLLRGWVGDRLTVIFDIRGTGESGPPMCPALTITENDIASLDLSMEEAQTLERGAYLACRDELLNEGIDVTAYHGRSIARDVRDIREALGYAEWDLFGGSYGSWIARRVLREDPQGTRSATIMAGPPPDPTQLLTRDIPFFHRALKHVFSRCNTDPSCASHHPKIEQVFYETYEQLERNSWTVPVDPRRFRRSQFTVNGQDYIRMMYWSLGDRDFMHLPALVAAFHDRDEVVARRVIDRHHGGLSSTFSTGMAYSVECYESHTPTSRAERERLAAPYPAPLLAIRDFLAPCEDLHAARASTEERALVRSEIPTLIISAELDAMGPPEVGEEIHRLLPNSFHIVLPDAAHNAAFGPRYQPCLKEIVTDFLADPTTPPPAHCLDALPEPTISLELPDWARGNR
ncbi:MAG TPA: alpha/beta fold hydrolase, partial [Longimicrobiaceae bacterium]|nr:alpha/beta fold hydrolase [Longimicrobiaceae bacterium]